MTVGTGHGETVDALQPVPDLEGRPTDLGGPTRIGELVGGKYRISRYLAEGGMGVVYEAQHAVVKRRFAVKFLRADFARRRENLGRFQREAEAAGGLESEHIASVVDFGITADGSPYIVMEYLAGESLASLLGREGSLPCGRAADLCVQACHGAETAHAAGIVHRDIKPHNVFVCRREDGTDLLKILDFGIAKLELIKHDQVSTQTGTVLGTPAYMSPEQARGERTVDPRTDVYSLGAIFYEMLSGRLPHPGDSPNAVLYHISTQPAVPLATVAPHLPQPLLDLVDRALSSDPGARPQSAKAFAAQVSRFATREAWPEPPRLTTPTAQSGDSASARKAEAPVPGAGPSPADVADPNRHRRRPVRTWAPVVVVGIVLVAAAGAISSRWFGMAPRSSGDPAGAAGRGGEAERSERRAAASGQETPARAPRLSATPPPTAKSDLSANAEGTQRPAQAVPVSVPPTDPGSAMSPPREEPARAKAFALKRAPASGRPVGRLAGRPAATANESAGDGRGSGAPAEASSPAQKPFPRPSFDPENPYRSP